MKRTLLTLLLIATTALGTVTTLYEPEYFNCNGSVTDFVFTFRVEQTTDVDVYLRIIATGVETKLTLNSDYSLSATNNDYSGGGTVTTVSTYSSAYQIIIGRSTELTQEAQFVNNKALENTLDRSVMSMQEVQSNVNRSLRAPIGDESPNMELPSSVERASKFIAFDSDGNVMLSSGPTSVPVSIYIETLLDDSTAAIARTTLGVGTTDTVTIADLITKGPWADVRAYGAVGDGTTDDTVAIQAASTAAGTSGIVFFPDGEYKVTDAGGLPVTFHPEVLYVGESREGVIITNTSTTKYAFEWLSEIGDPLAGFANPGGFIRMNINGKFGIRMNQTLGDIGGIFSGDWFEQDIPIGWIIQEISFNGDASNADDPNKDTNAEPSDIDDYTTYGIGLQITRPTGTKISQCAFRNFGVGLYMEGADLTEITNNRFISNSCQLYATNGTGSTFGFNSKFSHNDIVLGTRRRHVWLKGEEGKMGGWTLSDNFFEAGGPEAEYIYIYSCFGHKIHSNFFNSTSQDATETPIINFVGDSYDHLVYGNTYGVSGDLQAINVDWTTGIKGGGNVSGGQPGSSRKWLYYYGNGKQFPKPNNPRMLQKGPDATNPYVFDCVANADKWEQGDAHNDAAPFVKFDGFYHLDTSTGTATIYFRDDRVDRLTSFIAHIKGVVTGGASGSQDIALVIQHDTTSDYTGPLLENVTDGELVDVRVAVQSDAGPKRFLFTGSGFIAISSITIEPATPQLQIHQFTDSDATPSVQGITFAKSNTTGVTITRFDDGVEGQELTIISKGVIVYDTSTATRLIGSSVDITTASGDITMWICETGGTTSSVWRLKGFVDVSADNSGGV